MDHHGWQVLDEDAGVLWREYRFSGKARATTLVCRGTDGGLIVVSPGTGLSAMEYDALKDFGEVRALIANNTYHHLGQQPWRAHFKDALSYAPPRAVEALRIASPHALVIAAGYAIVLDAMPLAEEGQWNLLALELAVAGLIFGVGTFLAVALFKWMLLGRYRKRNTPMWTPFVWLSEAATNMYEGIAVPNFLRYLRGTPWLPLALNLLGTRIATSAYLDTTDMTEFDCVQIGAHSELNALCCPQTHLFEDRIMKIGRVRIGAGTTIRARSTVLYDAEVGDGALLGPLTLVLKGERIPDDSAWLGSPAQPGRR